MKKQFEPVHFFDRREGDWVWGLDGPTTLVEAANAINFVIVADFGDGRSRFAHQGRSDHATAQSASNRLNEQLT